MGHVAHGTRQLRGRFDPCRRDAALVELPRSVLDASPKRDNDAVERGFRPDAQREHPVLRSTLAVHAQRRERLQCASQVTLQRSTPEHDESDRHPVRASHHLHEDRPAVTDSGCDGSAPRLRAEVLRHHGDGADVHQGRACIRVFTEVLRQHRHGAEPRRPERTSACRPMDPRSPRPVQRAAPCGVLRHGGARTCGARSGAQRPPERRPKPGHEKPPTAFPLAGGPSSVSTQSAPEGIRTPNLLIRRPNPALKRSDGPRPGATRNLTFPQVRWVRRSPSRRAASLRNRDCE